MNSSSCLCLDGCSAEHYQPDHMTADLDVLGVPVTLHKEIVTTLPESSFYSTDETASSLVCSNKVESDATRDSTTKRHLSPASGSCGHQDWSVNPGRQAKRARVENIIKGMTSSPVMQCTETNQHEEWGCVQKKEIIQEPPIHQEHIERSESDGMSQTREQLESQHQQLRTRFVNADKINVITDSGKEKYPSWNNSPDTSPRDALGGSYSKFERSGKYQGWKKVKLINYFQTRPERIKLMADVLKYELSRAVSTSVDYIFKSMPLLQASPNYEGSIETDVPLQSPECKDNKCRFSYSENPQVYFTDVQTEALSLVVQKPQASNKLIFQSISSSPYHVKPPVALDVDSALRDQSSKESQRTLRCLQDEHSDAGQPKFETFDTYWNSVKVRSKVNSRSVRSPQARSASLDPALLENLCLPHVKIEPDSLVKNNVYMLNVSLASLHYRQLNVEYFTHLPTLCFVKCFSTAIFSVEKVVVFPTVLTAKMQVHY